MGKKRTEKHCDILMSGKASGRWNSLHKNQMKRYRDFLIDMKEEESVSKFKVELGEKVKDSVTGFKGTVTARAE